MRSTLDRPALPNLQIVSEKVKSFTSQTATYFFNGLLSCQKMHRRLPAMASAPNGQNRAPSHSNSSKLKMTMQQSSSSIADLAAALAKAQVELVNPEKSMVATVPADGKGAAEQMFRYAPLSSELDIVRKTLGRHEIATVQATPIDHVVICQC